MISGGNLIHIMKGTQFPFGVLNTNDQLLRKIFVKKRYLFNNEEEYEQLKAKVERLKTISHKNAINLRST
jgi:hypothetical protein